MTLLPKQKTPYVYNVSWSCSFPAPPLQLPPPSKAYLPSSYKPHVLFCFFSHQLIPVSISHTLMCVQWSLGAPQPYNGQVCP